MKINGEVYQIYVGNRRFNMIILAIITTIVIGWIGTAFGHDYMNFTELGPILSIATMGGFIMFKINKMSKNNKDD